LKKRNFETDICYPTNKGTLKPLARINRNPKWNTDGVTPNDQYVLMINDRSMNLDQSTILNTTAGT